MEHMVPVTPWFCTVPRRMRIPYAVKVELSTKIAIIVGLSVLFLLCSRIPLFGIQEINSGRGGQEVASVPGTPLGLGLAPLVAWKILFPYVSSKVWELELVVLIAIAWLQSAASGCYYWLTGVCSAGGCFILAWQLFLGALGLILAHELFTEGYAPLRWGFDQVWFPALRLVDKLLSTGAGDTWVHALVLALATLELRNSSKRCLHGLWESWATPLQLMAMVLDWWSPEDSMLHWIMVPAMFGLCLHVFALNWANEHAAAVGWTIGVLTMVARRYSLPSPTACLFLIEAIPEFRGQVRSSRAVKRRMQAGWFLN